MMVCHDLTGYIWTTVRYNAKAYTPYWHIRRIQTVSYGVYGVYRRFHTAYTAAYGVCGKNCDLRLGQKRYQIAQKLRRKFSAGLNLNKRADT